MKHSERETFFWLEAAKILDRVQAPDCATNADPKLLQDFSRVRQSLDLAETILIRLARREVSIDELDSHKNEASPMRLGALHVDVKKKALAHIGATGNTADRLVFYAIKNGIITDEDVVRAKKRKRHPEFDGERIGIVPQFLVKYWCGEKGEAGTVHKRKRQRRVELTHKFSCFVKDGKTVSSNEPGARLCHHEWPRQDLFIPPLCFFTNKALSDLVSILLNQKSSALSVRKSLSRLRLVRPSRSSAPRIGEVRQHKDGLCFCP